ncbi:uncharacterized protein LOC119965918 isoform X2 [Scyliorhinus canicula]|uniref:uncharacterized protein LOC119965918 isoform X2 n=1 Tax=Scyliorhinus canicula TaxID=7830 RepID=UPI0018F7C4E8|nr:uncharacterized protein LOC119965918 isoform X2 [Scyliorhinus canicula]
MRLGIVIRVAWIIHLQTTISAFETYYYLTTRHSSIYLSGYTNGSIFDVRAADWYFLSRNGINQIVSHNIPMGRYLEDPFYTHRIKYDRSNTSLVLFNLDLDDSGVYEFHLRREIDFISDHLFSYVLEVQEILPHPLIIRDSTHEPGIIYLNCFMKYGETHAILWLKDGQLLQDDETYKLSNSNGSLMINTQQITTCEMYTCVIRNKVSQKEISHLLVSDEWLSIHKFSFIASIMALVSTTTSFAASSFIIFFALRIYKVQKRHMQLTAVFIFFQMVAFIFLLIAALLCIIDLVYPIAYRIIEGIGFILLSGTVTYIIFYYLQPETRVKRSFLMKKKHHNFFLVYGIFSMILSALPIYRGQRNITNCQFPVKHILGTIASGVLIYVFIMGLSFVLFLKYMMSWPKVQRHGSISSRRQFTI